MSWVNIYPVVILLGVMILIHELGHYWAAISVGIRVDTFSIGFGPRLFGFKRGDTDFRVSLIPLGGYVRMFGELPGEESAAADPRSFLGKARWQRAIVVAAGPLMNIVLAIAIVTGLYMHALPKEVDPQNPVITTVAANSSAAKAGIEPGDRIIQIGSQKNPNWEDVENASVLNANHPLAVVVQRGRQTLHLTVVPALDPEQGIGEAGWNADPDIELGQVDPSSPAAKAGLKAGDFIISINHKPMLSVTDVLKEVVNSGGKPLEVVFMRDGQIHRLSVTPAPNNDSRLPWRLGVLISPHFEMVKLAFGPALMESLRWNAKSGTLILDALKGIVERRVSPKSIQGPISIARMSTQAAEAGAVSFLLLMAAVSLNLAIVNLLPIPILDGASLLTLIIEMVMQREVSMRVKETALKLGFVFLMMLVVFVLYNDISHLHHS